MNFQKITMTAAAVGLMLSAAVPALAWGGHYRGGNDVEISVENDDTHVTNNVVTVSNTGFNKVDGGHSWWSRHNGGSINTGDAWALSDVYNDVNNTTVDVCDCLAHRRGDVEISVENDDTHVTNNVVTVSNTGFNKVDGRGRIRTGNAGSEAVVTNFVNTTVIGGSN